MGRKKQYQYTDVLNKGLEVFWHYGYENLTVDDLIKHTGLNRDSLYKVFGNKQQFFVKVMQHYIDYIFEQGPGRYLHTHQGMESIALFISSAIDSIDNRGCFITNADANYLVYPDEIKAMIDDYKQRLKTLFGHHLNLEGDDAVVQEQNALILLSFFGGALAIQKGSDHAQTLKLALKKLIETL